MEKKYLKKVIVVLLLLMFIGASVLPSLSSFSSVTFEEKNKMQSTTTMQTVMTMQTIWTVDNEPGVGDFDKIQDAISDSQVLDGHTIEVYSGTYYEYVVVNKQLNIVGVNGELPDGSDTGRPVIDGGGTGDVVNITADYVNISGFTIQNSGDVYIDDDYDSGIQIWGNNSIITYNNITDNLAGIANMPYRFMDRYKGLNLNISYNTFWNNSIRGIALWYSFNSNVTCNMISNSSVGIGWDYPENCNISCNNISTKRHSTYGMSFFMGGNNKIFNNSLWAPNGHFDIGIDVRGTKDVYVITGNTVQHSGTGIYISGNNYQIYHNNLMNNNQNAEDSTTNNWNTACPDGGNYWDDWSPPPYYYEIPGGNNVDNCPLEEPWICCCVCNKPPIANDDTYSICFGENKTFNVLLNDSDPDGNEITIDSVTTPTSGGTTKIVGSGKETVIEYTPGTGFFGTDTFTYTISDGYGGTDTATVTVNVCCIEIEYIRLHPNYLNLPIYKNVLQVGIRNHCGMDLRKRYLPSYHDDRVRLTWEFTIEPDAPCCGGTAFLTSPPGPGPLVYVAHNRRKIEDTKIERRGLLVEGNACFTLRLTAYVPPTGCSCEKIITGCVADLQIC